MEKENIFGKQLKRARTAAKMTQLRLAELVNMNPRLISRYEVGDTIPSVDGAGRLAVALGVDLDWLIGRYKDRLKGGAACSTPMKKVARGEHRDEVEKLRKENKDVGAISLKWMGKCQALKSDLSAANTQVASLLAKYTAVRPGIEKALKDLESSRKTSKACFDLLGKEKDISKALIEQRTEARLRIENLTGTVDTLRAKIGEQESDLIDRDMVHKLLVEKAARVQKDLDKFTPWYFGLFKKG